MGSVLFRITNLQLAREEWEWTLSSVLASFFTLSFYDLAGGSAKRSLSLPLLDYYVFAMQEGKSETYSFLRLARISCWQHFLMNLQH
jgi:hypothetical protein